MSKVNVCTEFHQCVYTIPGAYIHYIQHLPFAALDAKDNDNGILTTATIISSFKFVFLQFISSSFYVFIQQIGLLPMYGSS